MQPPPTPQQEAESKRSGRMLAVGAVAGFGVTVLLLTLAGESKPPPPEPVPANAPIEVTPRVHPDRTMRLADPNVMMRQRVLDPSVLQVPAAADAG